MTRSDFEFVGLHKVLGAFLCCVCGQKEGAGLKVPPDSAFDLHFLPKEGNQSKL